MGRYWLARLFAGIYQVAGLILVVIGVGIVLAGLNSSTLSPTLAFGMAGVVAGGSMTAFGQTMLAVLDMAESIQRIEHTHYLLQAIGDEVVTASNRLKELTISSASAANDLHSLTESARKKP